MEKWLFRILRSIFFFVGIDCNQSTMDVKEKKRLISIIFVSFFFCSNGQTKFCEKRILNIPCQNRNPQYLLFSKMKRRKKKIWNWFNRMDQFHWSSFLSSFFFFSFLKRMLKKIQIMMELDSLPFFLFFHFLFSTMMMMMFQTWIEYASTEFHNKNWTYILWPFAKTKKKFFTENDAALLF